MFPLNAREEYIDMPENLVEVGTCDEDVRITRIEFLKIALEVAKKNTSSIH